MIAQICLKFGSSTVAPPLEFAPGPITVIVGPNYSGKSKLIREIRHRVTEGNPSPDNVILEDLALSQFDPLAIDDVIDAVTVEPNPGEVVQPGHVIVGRLNIRSQVNIANLREALIDQHSVPQGHHYRNWAGNWYFSAKTRLLDGQSRMALANDQPFGDLNQNANSTFQQLFRDDELRLRVRKIVKDAFDLYLVTDPTNAGHIRLRLSERPPVDLEEEQSLTQRTARFHNQATMLSQASDGTKAFVGILIEIMAGNPDLLLLDEPEAFLHPGLSYKLGLEIARQVHEKNKNIVVSTHSPNFLMGCVASGVAVNVVRLTYNNGVATARMLPAESLSALMRNPLLRSANVLSALFYDSVILTEGDSDRAFYQEINHRLQAVGRGISNALFVNANGKDAIPVMMAPLKELGVSVAAIYDIDFVKDGGRAAIRRLEAAQIPGTLHSGISASRLAFKTALEAADVHYKRRGGANLLSNQDKEAFFAFQAQLSRYGIFLVPNGEVEGWLKQLEIGGHASEWLIPMFEKLGDEGSEGYLPPSNDDVWAFLDSIGQWLREERLTSVA